MDYRRVRLHLDFPSLELNQKCWLLFDVTRCKSISDLSYLIKKRFNLSKPMTLNLTLDDFLLPALESIHVVRDNDVIHVTSAVMSCSNGSILQKKHVKRTNSVSDHSFSLSPPPARKKKQKSDNTKVTNKKSIKRKNSDSNNDVISKSEKIQSTEPTLICKQLSPKELRSHKSVKRSTKEKKTTNVSNSLVTSKTTKTRTLLKPGVTVGEMTVVQPNHSSLLTQSNVRSNHIYFNNSSDENEENDNLSEHIEQQDNQCISTSPNTRSEIIPAGSTTDSETTRTPQLDQIPSETQQATDYSSLPTLTTVPNIGDRVAFKTLELSSDYTPILSQFKEGTVISFNLVQQSFVIELSDQTLKLEEMKLKEYSSGKFALPEPLPEGPEKNIEIEFKDLIEPKLLI